MISVTEFCEFVFLNRLLLAIDAVYGSSKIVWP